MMRGELVRPEGLELSLDVIDETLERETAAAIQACSLEPMIIHDNPSRRRVAHFGVSYTAATRSTGAAPPIPEVFLYVVRKAARALGAEEVGFEEVLVTDYPAGAGIGSHRDAPAFGRVIGISLLSPCTLRFARGSGLSRQVWEQLLPPRSAYLLSGAARTDWKHGIRAVTRQRMSVTARELRPSRHM